MSYKHTESPVCASTCAMPLPIVPEPSTAADCMVCAFMGERFLITDLG